MCDNIKSSIARSSKVSKFIDGRTTSAVDNTDKLDESEMMNSEYKGRMFGNTEVFLTKTIKVNR